MKRSKIGKVDANKLKELRAVTNRQHGCCSTNGPFSGKPIKTKKRRFPQGGVKDAELTEDAWEIDSIEAVYGNEVLVYWGRRMKPGYVKKSKEERLDERTLEDIDRLRAILNDENRKKLEHVEAECNMQCRLLECREQIDFRLDDVRQCMKCHLHTHLHCTASHLDVDLKEAEFQRDNDTPSNLRYVCETCQVNEMDE